MDLCFNNVLDHDQLVKAQSEVLQVQEGSHLSLNLPCRFFFLLTLSYKATLGVLLKGGQVCHLVNLVSRLLHFFARCEFLVFARCEFLVFAGSWVFG